jgi:small subunit ribosomal protein S8
MYIDLLTQIKNAQAAGRKSFKFRFSKMDAAIADLLVKRGFLKRAEVKGRLPKRVIEVELNPDRKIQGVKFLSKPSRHLYSGYKDLRPIKGGFGLIVLSTPKGILSDREAKKQKVGGEVLFEIW